MGIACTFCKKRKRKCDGESPCSICQKYNRNGKCEYLLDQDKRKFKYDSTYVDYLEMKVDLLQQLADELIRSDITKAETVDCELVKERRHNNLSNRNTPEPPTGSEGETSDYSSNRKNNNSEKLLRELADGVAVDEFVSTKWRVRQDMRGHTEFYGPISWRQQVLETNNDVYDEHYAEEFSPTQIEKMVQLVSESREFREVLILTFANHFAKFFYISELSLDEVRTWDFPNQDISKQLLLCAIFTYGSVFRPVHKNLSAFFLRESESLVLKASKHANEYYIQATLILSCFQLGMGRDSNSWAFDAMTSAMTQYLKLDRADELEASTKSSALFWSVILQDRVITSVLGRGCRIQFFRITTPFFKPIISNHDSESFLTELTFAYHSKLWFIHDRYLSQIYSFKADHLHNSHKITLMNKGIESLHNLKDSLPPALKLTDDVHDSRILILHLSYSVVVLLLHRAYLKQVPLKVIQIIIEHCEIATNIISRLLKNPNPNIPYFISYLILTCATFDLFLLTNKDASIKANSLNRLKVYIDALSKFGQYWKRCLKDIKVLDELATKWNLDLPFLKQSSTILTVDRYINSEGPSEGISYNRFFDQFVPVNASPFGENDIFASPADDLYPNNMIPSSVSPTDSAGTNIGNRRET